MSQIGTLTSFSASTTMVSADVNGNVTACRTAHNSARQPFIGNVQTGAPAGTNYYWFGSFAFHALESKIPLPCAMTLSYLSLRLDAAQPNDGSLVVTVRKNGVDTALTVTVAANAASGTYQDTSDTVSFAAGDLYSLKVVNNSASTSPLKTYSFLGDLSQVASPVAFSPNTPILASDMNSNFSGFQTAHGASRYAVLSGKSSAGTAGYYLPGYPTVVTVTNAEWVAPIAGTVTSFYTNGGSGACTIYQNDTPTALTVTAGVGVVSDTTHTVTVAAGDRLGVYFSTGVPDGYSFAFAAASVGAMTTFSAGTEAKSSEVNGNFAALKTAHNAERIPSFVISHGNSIQLASGVTVYDGPSVTASLLATQSAAQGVMPIATTMRNLSVRIGGTPQPAGGTLVVTVQKNGTDTALTVTFSAGASAYTTQQDTSDSVALAAGDLINLKIVNNDGTAASATLLSASATFDL